MKFLVGFFSLEWMRVFDFIAPLFIRLFLAPLFWVAGVQHLGLFSSSDFTWWNPLTWINMEAFQQSVSAFGTSLFAGMPAETLLIVIGCLEVFGAILLIFGFAVRWIVLGLMFVVTTLWLMSLGDSGALATLQQLAMTHGYSTISNNPNEVALVTFILLISLFFMGAGRWVSLDWFIYRSFAERIAVKHQDPSLLQQDPFEIDATDEPGIRSTDSKPANTQLASASQIEVESKIEANSGTANSETAEPTPPKAS